jgi:hypothetical protein
MPHSHSPPRLNQARNRNQFRAWLIWMLRERGAQLSEDPSYQEIHDALLPYLMRVGSEP